VEAADDLVYLHGVQRFAGPKRPVVKLLLPKWPVVKRLLIAAPVPSGSCHGGRTCTHAHAVLKTDCKANRMSNLI